MNDVINPEIALRYLPPPYFYSLQKLWKKCLTLGFKDSLHKRLINCAISAELHQHFSVIRKEIVDQWKWHNGGTHALST